jgi:hypothetical protein
MEDHKIYVVVAATIQVPLYPNTDRLGTRTVIQPAGRQIAQACHVTNTLRILMSKKLGFEAFEEVTTIILQARDTLELNHVYDLLTDRKLGPVVFGDENPEYGPEKQVTAVAVLATPKQVFGILDYLPLWGSNA